MPLFRPDKREIAKNAGKWNVVITEDACKACDFCLQICPVDVFDRRKVANKIGWFPVYVASGMICPLRPRARSFDGSCATNRIDKRYNIPGRGDWVRRYGLFPFDSCPIQIKT